MSEDIDGFGGDEDGSGSGGYFPTPIQPKSKRRIRKPVITFIVGLIVLAIGSWGIGMKQGTWASIMFLIGFIALCNGLIRMTFPQDKHDSLV